MRGAGCPTTERRASASHARGSSAGTFRSSRRTAAPGTPTAKVRCSSSADFWPGLAGSLPDPCGCGAEATLPDAAARAASNTFGYVPQRHRFPETAWRTSASEGCGFRWRSAWRSVEHTSELQSLAYLVCRLLLEKKKKKQTRENQS